MRGTTKTGLLTPTQQSVLNYIAECLRKNGMPPTRREIANHFKWRSDNAAQAHLKLIERKGYIRLLNGSRSRGIQIL